MYQSMIWKILFGFRLNDNGIYKKSAESSSVNVSSISQTLHLTKAIRTAYRLSRDKLENNSIEIVYTKTFKTDVSDCFVWAKLQH